MSSSHFQHEEMWQSADRHSHCNELGKDLNAWRSHCNCGTCAPALFVPWWSKFPFCQGKSLVLCFCVFVCVFCVTVCPIYQCHEWIMSWLSLKSPDDLSPQNLDWPHPEHTLKAVAFARGQHVQYLIAEWVLLASCKRSGERPCSSCSSFLLLAIWGKTCGRCWGILLGYFMKNFVILTVLRDDLTFC